ncbi:MAG: hypothetical protein ACR2F6_02825 [Mycobacteriales bacterium]
MYAWLWHHLPGQWPAKLAGCLVLVAAVLVVLVLVVFPWIQGLAPFNHVTVHH